jgi:hypothetical protein
MCVFIKHGELSPQGMDIADTAIQVGGAREGKSFGMYNI